MIHPAYILFGCFFLLMFLGVPIAAALGLAGTLVISLAHLGIMAVPTNVYAGIAKYPLLAIPMFVLAGAIFDKAGVAGRLLRFTEAIVGRGRGALAVITILVAMIIGGISGSGPACTAAVGGVMLNAMLRDGYPAGFRGGRHGRRRVDRHPDPALGRLHRLQRARALGHRAGAVRGRRRPGHPGLRDAHHPRALPQHPLQLRRRPERRAETASLGLFQGRLLGPGRAGPHPGRPAHRAGSPRPRPR